MPCVLVHKMKDTLLKANWDLDEHTVDLFRQLRGNIHIWSELTARSYLPGLLEILLSAV